MPALDISEACTYYCSINTILKLLNSFVHIDGEGLSEVSTVVVLTVRRRQPLHMIIGNVTPPPQKSGKSDVVLGSGRPNWFNLILNNENVTSGVLGFRVYVLN